MDSSRHELRRLDELILVYQSYDRNMREYPKDFDSVAIQDFPKSEWRLSLSKPDVVPEAAFDKLRLRSVEIRGVGSRCCVKCETRPVVYHVSRFTFHVKRCHARASAKRPMKPAIIMPSVLE